MKRTQIRDAAEPQAKQPAAPDQLRATGAGGSSPAQADVETTIAADMARRAVPAVPLVVGAAALGWGGDGAVSAAVAVAIVLVNLTLAAVSLAWAARVSPAALMAAALGGFLLRMGLVVLALFLLRDVAWIDFTALAVVLLVTQLGLLFWEARYVSASLAFPGLAPRPTTEGG